jgi:hypothetical protein
VRTERGPLLKTYERPRIVEGGVRGEISVQWPRLSVKLSGFDTCRTEVVEEYAEDKIRERRGTGAGASLSAGIVFTAASGVLLGVGQLLSAEPNRQVIDGAGNYGPAPRTVARGWSIGLVAVGIPTLLVGIVQMLRVGEEVETVKVEELASQREEICNVRAVDGPLYLLAGGSQPVGPLPTQGATLTVEAASLTRWVDGFAFYEREVALDDPSKSVLEAFNGCLRLERESAAAVEALPTNVLVERLEAARACRRVRGDAVAAEQARLEAELARRRQGGDPGAFLPGQKNLKSFEEAVAAHPPRFTLEAGGPRDVELNGQTVLLKGYVQAGLSPNIGVVKVGDRDFFVFVPPDAGWASQDFALGAPVEVLGVGAGPQTVGERTAPLVKALWMRKVSDGRQ